MCSIEPCKRASSHHRLLELVLKRAVIDASQGISWNVHSPGSWTNFAALVETAMGKLASLVFWTACVTVASSTSIVDIHGTAWVSPLLGQAVTNVTGLVTAKVCIFLSDYQRLNLNVLQSNRRPAAFI